MISESISWAVTCGIVAVNCPRMSRLLPIIFVWSREICAASSYTWLNQISTALVCIPCGRLRLNAWSLPGVPAPTPLPHGVIARVLIFRTGGTSIGMRTPAASSLSADIDVMPMPSTNIRSSRCITCHCEARRRLTAIFPSAGNCPLCVSTVNGALICEQFRLLLLV